LKIVANNHEYIEPLKSVILHLRASQAARRETMPVHEVVRGQTVWRGDVEDADITGHPKTKRCYAWYYDELENFIAILELPPVKSAQDAVRVGVAYQARQAPKVRGMK
jgi:hypothetical protein